MKDSERTPPPSPAGREPQPAPHQGHPAAVQGCKDVFALLSQYLDEELPDDACREIESHISGCPPCVEFVESLRKSIELCHSRREAEQPGPLPEEARARLYAAYQGALAARRKAGL
jgi:RNA polymerase sigma-70 factor (ECF subfamily)